MAQYRILSVRFKADTSLSGENVGQVQKDQASQICFSFFFFLSANASPLLGAGKTQRVPSSSDPGLPA